jgi:ADP-heptose:LPS heptosyltransferase
MSLKNKIIKLLLQTYRLLPKSKGAIKTVALISNTAIGDTLMATPAIRAVKNAMPNVRIVAVLNPANAVLFATNPYIDEIVLYGGRWRGFFSALARLKRAHVGAALLLHSNEPQATPLAVLSGAKTVVKIPNDKNPFASLHSNPKTASPSDRHGIFDRLEQLKFLGVEAVSPRMELFLTDDWKSEAKKFLASNGCENRKVIGFQIGASTKSRMWFEERWVELAKMLLLQDENIRIVLTGSPKEAQMTQRIRDLAADERVVNAAGALPIGAAAALIGEFCVFVTPDTGPMHIAIALRVPSVALYAVADPVKSGAVYDKDIHIEIKKPRTCDPCVSKLCKYQECMLQITTTETKEAISKLLQ